MNKLVVKNYVDVTWEWINNSKPNSHYIKEQLYFEYKEKIYYVDGKNVILDYSTKELEVAKWLERTFGGEIYMLPRVNKPDGIKTADYLWNGEYWDLKEIFGCGKNVLFHAVEDHEEQAHNFIFDFSNSKFSNNEIYKRINKLFYLKKVYWIDKVIIKRNDELILVIKKQPLRLTVGPLIDRL